MKLRTAHYMIRPKDPANQPAKPFCAAVLADLHDARIGDDHRLLLERLQHDKVDAVLCAGDLVTASGGGYRMENALRLIELLAAQWPVYLVNGNHELRMKERPEAYGDAYERYLAVLARCGAVLLSNGQLPVCWNGLKVSLAGFEGALSQYHRMGSPVVPDEKALRQALSDPLPGRYHILLAHHPDYFQAYAAWGADLTVSGHLHGGMFRLPLIGGVIGSTLRPFPEYDRGRFRLYGKEMIVSAGLGTHSGVPRILNPRELVLLHFVRRDRR